MEKKISDFYQTIKSYNSNGKEINHDIFDYKKIWYDKQDGKNVLLYVIISERGRKAKTTQGKYLAKWIWDNFNSKTIWGMNSDKILEKEKRSHLNKPIQFHKDIFNDEKVIGNVIWTYKDDKDKEGKDIRVKDKWYQKFVPLSLAEQEKGSRDDYELLIIDEYNVGDRQIKNQKVDLFSSLIATMDDPINSNKKGSKKLKKIILHANNKSLNDPFLIALGILSIKKEVTNIKVGDRVIGRVLAPMLLESDKELFESDNENNELFLLQKKLGKADHVYYNENLFDELNYVNQWMSSIKPIIFYNVKVKNLYYQYRILDTDKYGRVLYIINLNKKPEGILYTMNKKDVIENSVYNVNLKDTVFKMLSKEKIFFFSAYIREEIINAITK